MESENFLSSHKILGNEAIAGEIQWYNGTDRRVPPEVVLTSHQGIYYNPEDEVFLYGSQQPSRRSDWLYQMQQDCS